MKNHKQIIIEGEESLAEALCDSLGGEVETVAESQLYKVDNQYAEGEVRVLGLCGELSFVYFNLNTYADISIAINRNGKKPYYFSYASGGGIHLGYNGGSMNRLKRFQPAICRNSNADFTMKLEAQNHHHFSVIKVPTCANSTGQGTFNQSIRYMMDMEQDIPVLDYKGSNDLTMDISMNRLFQISEEGLATDLTIASIAYEMLGSHIRQYSEDMNRDPLYNSALTRREMDIVREITHYINRNLDLQLNMEDLSRKFGLSPAKIQKGFKLMHHKTTACYIKECRMKEAEKLIRTTELNISEVVYSIGLNSRSYFSKIFKETFDCSPSTYKGQNGGRRIGA